MREFDVTVKFKMFYSGDLEKKITLDHVSVHADSIMSGELLDLNYDEFSYRVDQIDTNEI